MRRFRAIAVAAIAAVVAAPAQTEVSLPAALQVLGNVTNAAKPVANALIIALNLSSFEAVQTYTSGDGSFSLPPLQSGIYKVIAVKAGFLPAVTTVVPTKNDHRLRLRMEEEKQTRGRRSQEIWEIRGSLPPDILRELDMVMSPPQQLASYEVPRFRGEMLSMTAVANDTAAPAFAQTALGVQSRLSNDWQIGIRGDMRRFEDPADGEASGRPLAEARVMEMELHSNSASYRVASTRSTWSYVEGENPVARQAGLRSHDFEWEQGDASVKVRYFEHDNVFSKDPFHSDVLEIGGNTRLVQTRRNDLAVSLRMRQESINSVADNALRTADLAANGRVEVVPSMALYYGMSSRVGVDRTEWAPNSGVEWRFAKNTSLIATAAYKVVDNAPDVSSPRLVVWSDEEILPRYSYSVGLVSSRNEGNRLSAIVTVSAVDSPLRVVFTDGGQQFWDGLHVDSGDVRRDLRLAYRRDFGGAFAIDVATTAGTATARHSALDEKVYITGDLQTIFTPTRTTLAVSYRELQQPLVDGARHYRSERVNLRMAQSLYLPIDVKLLLGVELTESENSPFLLDTSFPHETSRKYLGGLALNF